MKAKYIVNSVKNIDDPISAENKIKEALEILNSIKFNNNREINNLKLVAGSELINAKIRNVENIIKSAEILYKDGLYYDAKNKYRNARNYLDEILDESANYKISDEKINYIKELITICNKNIEKLIDELLKIEPVSSIDVGAIETLEEVKIKVAHSNMIYLYEKRKQELDKIYKEVIHIGDGGFAWVFKAVDERGHTYAIKVPRLLSEKDEEYFFNEVEKWKQLNHRNIVKLIKARVNPPHLVLEYVKGKDLKKLLEEKGKLDVFEACKIAFDVAKALEYAHNKRILHCDLKPSNILIDEELDEAKVTDFGLAKGTASSSFKGGTLDYLPPEAPDEYYEKSDVYQLGLLLYEMLAGKLPEDRKNPKPLGIELLDDLISRCLSENPDDRPTAREFRERLYEFVKERYGRSLKLTKDLDSQVGLLIECAVLAVRSKDLENALVKLETAKNKARPDFARKIEKSKVIDHIRYLTENNLTDDKYLDEVIRSLNYLHKVIS